MSRSILRVLVLAALILCLAPANAAAGTDDYPSNLKSAAQDSTFDPWQFYNRECTSFVAWRLNDRNGVGFGDYYRGQHWGNANHWDDAARALGIAVNSTPAVGAVAQTDAGGAGHVAWVEAVNSNGTVTIEEYNQDFTGHYSERSVSTSSFVYIHIKDLPVAHNPQGAFDIVSSPQAGSIRIRGWAFDLDAKTSAVTIHAYAGGAAGGTGAEGHDVGAAGGTRTDVGDAYPGVGDHHGFDATFSTAKTGSVPVCVYAINVGGGSNVSLGCKTVSVANPNPKGHLDEVSSPRGETVHIRGWAFDASSLPSSITIHTYVGGAAGQTGAEWHDAGAANVSRPDVNKVYPGVGNSHGFDTTFSTAKTGSVPVCVYAINIGMGANISLGCKTVKVEPPPPSNFAGSSPSPPAGKDFPVAISALSVGQNGLRATLACRSARECDGWLVLRAKQHASGKSPRLARRSGDHRKGVVIGRASFKLAANSSARIHVRRTRRGVAMLRRHSSLAAQLTIAVGDERTTSNVKIEHAAKHY